MKWEKTVRQVNEPHVLETVFVCHLNGDYNKAKYLGYGVYDVGGNVHHEENPIVEFMSITKPKRLI